MMGNRTSADRAARLRRLALLVPLSLALAGCLTLRPLSKPRPQPAPVATHAPAQAAAPVARRAAAATAVIAASGPAADTRGPATPEGSGPAAPQAAGSATEAPQAAASAADAAPAAASAPAAAQAAASTPAPALAPASAPEALQAKAPAAAASASESPAATAARPESPSLAASEPPPPAAMPAQPAPSQPAAPEPVSRAPLATPPTPAAPAAAKPDAPSPSPSAQPAPTEPPVPPAPAQAAPAEAQDPAGPPGKGQGTDLSGWQALGDPLLPELVKAAWEASPNLASARGRIERARAERTAADASWMPLVMGSAGTGQARSEPQKPVTRTTTAGSQASWEIDLFGAGRAGSAAGAARLAGAEQALQAARLSVAADTALSYIGLRACEAQRAVATLEAHSQQATVRVTESAAEAGYLSSDQASLARAAEAQARAILGARQAQCERLTQSLVALTAIDEAELRLRLAARTAELPMPAGAAPEAVPAHLIARRPDLQEAAQAVAAAGFDERAAEARRWPSISLQGSIGHMRASAGPALFTGQVWSLGPLQVTFPIFDGGVRKAQVQAAQASLEEAKALYQARVRRAVEEVEEALINLRSTRERELHARQAALGFATALGAAERRLQGGMASVLEVETTRRAATAAKAAVIDLQQTRANAWVSLYRVLGGNWD